MVGHCCRNLFVTMATSTLTFDGMSDETVLQYPDGPNAAAMHCSYQKTYNNY